MTLGLAVIGPCMDRHYAAEYIMMGYSYRLFTL